MAKKSSITNAYFKWKNEVIRLGKIIDLDVETRVDEQVLSIAFFDLFTPLQGLKTCVEVIVRTHEIKNNPLKRTPVQAFESQGDNKDDLPF